MWQDEMIPIVRGLVLDMDEPFTYSDARMQSLIVVSAILVVQEVSLNVAYTVNTQFACIEPDPTVSNDDDFIALTCLKTACMISSGEYRDASRKAISVKDGPSFIDTKERAKHLGEIAKDTCSKYEQSKKSFQIGDGSMGKGIIGPYAIGTAAQSRFS